MTVSNSGLATSVAPGSVNIFAASGSVTTHTGLAVNAALVSIAVTPSRQSVPVNGTQQFTATGAYNDASHKDITGSVTSSSSNTSIATVSGVGLATGSASIRATSASVSGSTPLTVTPILVSINVTAADSALDITTTSQFTATGNLSDAARRI